MDDRTAQRREGTRCRADRCGGQRLPEARRDDQRAVEVRVTRLTAHPVTRPWCGGGADVMFSWDTASPGRSACGIAECPEEAMKAVNEILTEHGGRGLVQRACLGAFNDDEAHQYAYGNVVAEAVAKDGAVMWRKP